MVKVGIVGYLAQKFDEEKARQFIEEAYNKIDRKYPDSKKEIVSGLTDLGIPAIAYREALKRKWKTVGIACSKAQKYPCFEVDKRVIVGKEWGEESPTFLDSIEVLVRVGGGKQSQRETAEAKARKMEVIEYDLPIKNTEEQK